MDGHNTEPSVEEILASIKKVIAQDGRQAALARDRSAPGASAKMQSPSVDDDVLELTGNLDPLPEAEEPLVSEIKRNAMAESLAALSTLAEPRAAPRIVQSGETSLEALVRELLRPMLSDWLDANLPDLVEAMVAKEISRITRKD